MLKVVKSYNFFKLKILKKTVMALTVEKKVKLLYSIIVILAIALAFMIFRSRKAVVEKNESFQQGVELKGELDKMMDEYTSIKIENQDLADQMSEKDSIIMANKAEIEKLIASQADYNKIRRKLDLLRKITQDYVVRIDSLVEANRVLVVENTQMKEEVNRVQEQKSQLEADKVELQEKITVASAFKAYDLTAYTVRVRADGKEVLTDRSRRVTRINLEFTLSENKIVEPGMKTIYARISRPDGIVMAMGSDDLYSFELNGERLQYTLKQDVEYRNESQEIRMFWDRKTDDHAMPGKYDVMLYMDGNEIGRTSFMIRE